MDLSATQAAIRAGYSEKTAGRTGFENLKKPEIAKAIQEAFLARSERTEITTDWVLATLVENVNRAMQHTQVLDKEGHPTDEWVYQGSVANKGLELIGRHLGMFVDKVEHFGKDGDPIEIRWVETILNSRVIGQDGIALTDGTSEVTSIGV